MGGMEEFLSMNYGYYYSVRRRDVFRGYNGRCCVEIQYGPIATRGDGDKIEAGRNKYYGSE